MAFDMISQGGSDGSGVGFGSRESYKCLFSSVLT